MVRYMNLEEQVDADFSRARRRALLRRMRTRLQRDNASNRLLCFDELRKFPGALGRFYRGMRTVPVAQIGGSVGRCSEFDRDFMPARASVGERWKRVDRAFWRGEELPPVSLYKVGGFYFVLDGHHRVSVARYHGVEWIDAHVTEFGGGAWSERGDRECARSNHPKERERTEGTRDDGLPHLEAASRGATARGRVESPSQSVAGHPQAGRWPEIGPSMGDKEASRTSPQVSEDLEERRLLGTKEVLLCGKEEQFLGRAGHSRA